MGWMSCGDWLGFVDCGVSDGLVGVVVVEFGFVVVSVRFIGWC